MIFSSVLFLISFRGTLCPVSYTMEKSCQYLSHHLCSVTLGHKAAAQQKDLCQVPFLVVIAIPLTSVGWHCFNMKEWPIDFSSEKMWPLRMTLVSDLLKCFTMETQQHLVFHEHCGKLYELLVGKADGRCSKQSHKTNMFLTVYSFS